VIKKHGMPASALYVRSVAEQHDAVVGKIRHLLGDFETCRGVPTAWQSHQLNNAMEFVVDGLYTLATCELEVLEEQLARHGKRIHPSSDPSPSDGNSPEPISMSLLREKLATLKGRRPAAPATGTGTEAVAIRGDLP